MVPKKTTKPKLTDERHKRFVEMAHEVEASKSPKAFDKAFRRVTSTQSASRPRPSGKKQYS
jgi:hypothetical protein